VTLVELIIVIIVIGIMAAALAPLALSSLQAYNNTLGDVVVLDKLRYAIERLSREIREVNYNSSTGFAFANMGTHSMAFTRTFYDSSGVASTATVTIGNTGNAVTLAYSNPPVAAQVLTDELDGNGGLEFAYFTSDGVAQANDQKDVRIVQIKLTLMHNGNPYSQLTQMQLKNFN